MGHEVLSAMLRDKEEVSSQPQLIRILIPRKTRSRTMPNTINFLFMGGGFQIFSLLLCHCVSALVTFSFLHVSHIKRCMCPNSSKIVCDKQYHIFTKCTSTCIRVLSAHHI